MPAFLQSPPKPDSKAQDLVSELSREILEATVDLQSRSEIVTREVLGTTVVMGLQRDKGRYAKVVYIHVETSAGMVSCGTSAYTAAALIIGLRLTTTAEKKTKHRIGRGVSGAVATAGSPIS
jgi:hypothetical protein